MTVRGVNGGGFLPLARPESGQMFRILSCTSCTIEGLVFDGNNVGVAPLSITASSGSAIQNNTFTNLPYPAQAAIVSWANRDNRYVGNTVSNTGIQYDSSGGIADATRGIWLGNESAAYYEHSPYVANNRLSNIGGTAIVVHAYSAVITGNVGTGLTWSGAKLVSPRDANGTTRIENNNFTGTYNARNSGGGIQIGSEAGNQETVIIQNNVLDGEVESGIYVARGDLKGQIINNIMRNNVEAGITITGPANGVLIKDNQIFNTRSGKFWQGIRLLADPGTSIRNIQFANNSIKGEAENGMLLVTNGGSIDGISITGNSLSDNGMYGVYIEERASSGALNNVTMSGNCFANNGSGTLYDARSGRALAAPASSSACSTPGVSDSTPPAVSVTSPANGQTVSGIVSVSANASDNTGVAAVQFRVNGAPLGADDTSAPYGATWDTTQIANGSYQITAEARDAAGNRTTSGTITVNVANTVADTTGPAVAITSPASGQTVSGQITVTASASDNIGIAGVQLLLNGSALGTAKASAPYAAVLDTRTLADGDYTLSAIATDTAGNRTTSAGITVKVSNSVVAGDTAAPSVSMTAPRAGHKVSGDVTLSANASDNAGVAAVQFLVDGAAAGAEDTTAPFAISWDSRTVANGAHQISAVARDAAGNRTTSAAVEVTVSNSSQSAAFKPILVNAGGPAYTDPSGAVWSADFGSQNGMTYANAVGIENTTNPALYQSLRWLDGTLAYQFTVPNGSYNVTLKFAEIYFGEPNQRVFNATINGSDVLTNFDIVAAAGGPRRAIDKTFPVTVINGLITISMVASVDAPQVNGIEIRAAAVSKKVIRVNSGGSVHVDANGTTWESDNSFVNGQTYAPEVVVAGTDTPEIYRTLRWDPSPLEYRFAVADGTYTVTLKFAEIYHGGTNQRVFDTTINGQQVLSNFDIVAAAGGPNRAADRSFSVPVTNGEIFIRMVATVDAPQVNAIEITD
ncbi:MAG TPA: malectin domain-containing carbohydrate-binding protein [Bryobacteraceae bacterium]|nr:malectin domain-containing carbohydrate-binding protein [Bryobacteraceae bacterium]